MLLRRLDRRLGTEKPAVADLKGKSVFRLQQSGDVVGLVVKNGAVRGKLRSKLPFIRALSVQINPIAAVAGGV